MSVPDEGNYSVLVTGGTVGLGRAIATGFAAAGADVIISARTASDCHRVASEISGSTPGTCTGIPCDLTRVESIQQLVDHVVACSPALKVLVNNAGAIAPGPLPSVGEEDWDRVLDINLKAVFFLTQKLVPALQAAATADHPASVINIGSFAGGRVGPNPHYPYTAAKAALRYLTQSLAKGLAADHINVNAIALGIFPTASVMMRDYSPEALDGMRSAIPAGRLGEAKDIVSLTRFLASSSASYITGATIPLDGGMHI